MCAFVKIYIWGKLRIETLVFVNSLHLIIKWSQVLHQVSPERYPSRKSLMVPLLFLWAKMAYVCHVMFCC